MGDLQVEVKDQRSIIVPVPTTAINTEQLGKFLTEAGQDDYALKDATLLTEERGTQREPWSVTKGVKLTVSK